MNKSDMKLFTNTGLLHTKSNYEELMADFNSNLYNNSLTLLRLKTEYKLVSQEIKKRKVLPGHMSRLIGLYRAKMA